ncbi:MAG TPA: 2'-deoxycytidine 5'-triphosphate deaminase [Actinomycetota bacterium]|nr:2'-deoxycytidine 5'-triphosphate deaminase [Actinomycetota bacterium]
MDFPTRAGVLPAQWLRRAIDSDVIRSDTYKIPRSNLQPASLDLRLGETAFRLRSSFLAGDDDVAARLDDCAMESFDLRDGAILERNRPYLIPLIEELALPEGLRAKANPKSSTGRLDVFTRVITDRSHRFDEIAEGYSGRLYLEVFSRTFTIKVRTGLALNQLRLVSGRAVAPDAAVLDFHRQDPVLFRNGQPVPGEELALSDGLFLSLDLRGDDDGFVGYRARKNSRLLDLSAGEPHDPRDFWEPVTRERGGRVILEPEEFYLLISSEAVRIPPAFAAEMTAYDPTSGELRTHYAGFFDPGFGHDSAGPSRGSRAVLEVRAHDVPFMVEDGQRVCRLVFEEMLEPPEILYGRDIGSSYQGQVVMLSKHFSRS